MAGDRNSPDIAAGRLSADEYAAGFADLHPPLDGHQALVEADRCYFCHDAPCTEACPTGIDIPMFIRQISTGNPVGAAETIFAQNIMGGTCARVCPVETLCEQACVRTTAEDKPVKIGLLQRHATDALFAGGTQPFARAAPSGRRVAVVGAGPAGLACAHRLAVRGHDVTVLEARAKPGGLNEFGIAAYKMIDDFARREADFILSVGGIAVEYGKALGRDVTVAALADDYDAVFLGFGMGDVNGLGLDGEELDGVMDAVSYIADLRQADDLAALPVGRRIVVIGGGMTAIDIAVQTKRLGAEDVTIAYRRGPDQMKASAYERHVAQTSGVRIKTGLMPTRVIGEDGHVSAVEFEYTAMDNGRLAGTGEHVTLAADMVFKAIGQRLDAATLGAENGALTLANDRIVVDADRRTSMANVWAGGDCIDGGQDLTVAAVEDGKIAAEAIDRYLAGLN